MVGLRKLMPKKVASDLIYYRQLLDFYSENEDHIDICIALQDAITWGERSDTDADLCSGGEATRRYYRAVMKLTQLGIEA